VAVGRRKHERGAVAVAREHARQEGIALGVVDERDAPRVERGERRLLHRHLDRLAPPVAGARQDRRERAGDGDGRGAVVSEEAREPARRPVGEARSRQGAGGGERRERFQPPPGTRAREAHVRDHHVDEPRMAGTHRLRGEVMGGALGGRRVLDQDVRLIAERVEPPPPGRVVEIKRDAALVRVAEQVRERAVRRDDATGERRGEPPRIPARRLDLDDVGAQVGEHPASERSAQVGEIEDAEMLERRRRHRHVVPGSNPGERVDPVFTNQSPTNRIRSVGLRP
jgi:hypothetical protein